MANYLNSGWRMRKMVTKLLATLCVMIFVGLMVVGPVSAAGPIATITGNPQDFISIYETGDITDWSFVQDALNVNTTSCTLNVSSNHIGWTVGVYDALTDSKPPETVGNMTEYQTGPGTYTTKHLINPMIIDGVSVTNQYSASPQPLTGGTQVVWTGANDPAGVGTWAAIPITIEQQVDFADQHLLTGSVYRIVVTFTAALP